MIVTYKEFRLINFPVFALPSGDLAVQDGILRCGHLVVDDRNQIGTNLGARRLQTPHELLKLRKAYTDIIELIRSYKNPFVDYQGYCFIYEKTRYCDVKYHKILKTVKRDTATVLKLSGLPSPVVVKRPPPAGKTWVGMLYFGSRPWIPYEYSEEHCANLRRKI